MRTALRKCMECKEYTLQEVCPICGGGTMNPLPPRFSPEDRYGKYRRMMILEQCGRYGKY